MTRQWSVCRAELAVRCSRCGHLGSFQGPGRSERLRAAVASSLHVNLWALGSRAVCLLIFEEKLEI